MKLLTESDVEIFIKKNKIDTTLLGTYNKISSNRNRLYLKLRCSNDHEYDQLWDNFKKKSDCPKCTKQNTDKKKYSFELVRKYLNDNGYDIVSEYKDSGTSFVCRCLNCNNESKTNFGNFLDGRRCRKCQGLAKKTTIEFKNEVFDLVNDEYIVIGEYITANDNIKIKHNICNTEYEVTPHNFLSNRRCPSCNQSKGEKKIENYLLNNKINFKRQYTFDDCKNNGTYLRFDFAIFDKNYNLNILIEYDGIQHFQSVELFGGEDGFQKRKINDNIKSNYCIKNNISLVRIPYNEFRNIEQIINKVVN